MQNIACGALYLAFFIQKDDVKRLHILSVLSHYSFRMSDIIASTIEQLAEDNGELPTTLHYIFCKKDGMKYAV